MQQYSPVSSFNRFVQRRVYFKNLSRRATNGLAERNVQTLKYRLKAMADDPRGIHEKVREILFRYRATPLKNGKTPSEQYLNRQIRIQLDALRPPKVSSLLLRINVNPVN